MEKRRFIRYAVTFPVEFASVSSPNIIHKAQAINISLGGLQIFVKGNLENNYDYLIINMFLPNNEIIKRAKAQVVYIKSAFDGTFMGVMFLELGMEKYNKLKTFLDSLVIDKKTEGRKQE